MWDKNYLLITIDIEIYLTIKLTWDLFVTKLKLPAEFDFMSLEQKPGEDVTPYETLIKD